MASVHFRDKPIKGDSVQIFLDFVYAKGCRFRYFTGIVLPSAAHWDKKKERVKASREFPQHIQWNARLKILENQATIIQGHYLNEQRLLSKEEFKREMDLSQGKVDAGERRQTFFQFFEHFISQRSADRRFAKGSIKVYQTTLNKLQEYEEHSKQQVDFPTFNFDFFTNFINYLFAKGFKTNYVDKLASTLKTVLKEAERKEVCPEFKYKLGWIKAFKENVEKIYLTLEELDAIWNLDLSGRPNLERDRDLFLIGCETGLRFSDFSSLNSNNIKNIKGVTILTIVTQKTGNEIQVPLNSLVLEILSKYGGTPPKAIQGTHMNKHLKIIGKMAGITDEIILTTFGVGRLKETQVKPKYELITTHTARRSFVTNAHKDGVPAIDIMQISGHKTESEFMKYIRLSNEEHALKMAEHPFFKDRNFKK